jgi:hypothetical protein
MKLPIKKGKNMGSDKTKKIVVGNKRAYYFEKKDKGENFNFHDYFVEDYSLHLIIEGGWHSSFSELINDHIQALSIISENEVDINFIAVHLSKIKQLYIKVNEIRTPEVIASLKELKFLSFSCQKSAKIHFDLPKGVTGFVVDWKPKYQLDKLPKSVEYLCIDKGKNIDWAHILVDLKSMVKIELIDCDINNGNVLISLPNLRYIALTNCKNISFRNTIGTNKALKYIYLQKAPLKNLKWIKSLQNLDILILENCGDIENIFPLKDKISIRGIWLSGNTKIINGDLGALETLVNLRNCFIRPVKNYTHKSLHYWNWKNFQKKQGAVISRVGK